MHDQRIKDGITYGMEHYMLHPKFFNYTIYDDYDMAIVTVKGRIKFNQHISPICLTQPQLTYVGKSATVSGIKKIIFLFLGNFKTAILNYFNINSIDGY